MQLQEGHKNKGKEREREKKTKEQSFEIMQNMIRNEHND